MCEGITLQSADMGGGRRCQGSAAGRASVAGFAVLFLGSCSRGESALIGSFGGTWTLGAYVVAMGAGGGAATYTTPDGGQHGDGGITVTKRDDGAFDLKVDAKFTQCELTAQIFDDNNSLGKRLRVDDHQRCKLSFGAFSGDANASGTLTPVPGGRLTMSLELAPLVRHGTDPESAIANFDGNRDWPAHPAH
jgi:hypothetical protein